jgi:hypothetical protein
MERSIGVGKEAMACFASTIAHGKGANQEMDINEIRIGKELAVAVLCLLLFGVSYNVLYDSFQKRTQHYTAEFVVVGVLVIVMTSGFLIGWGDAITVLILFVPGGGPMIVGSWMRHARDEEKARQIMRESAQELNQ